MKFFSKIFILLILLLSVYYLKSLSNLKLDSSDFEPSPEFSKQIPIVKGYEKMLEVYTFLFNAEQPKKSIGTDKIDKWNDYIILYRSSLVKNQLSRVVLSIQKMSFFCGVGKLCSIEEVSSKINQNEFAPQTSAFIQGLPDKKDCYADGYVWKSKTYGIVLCVNPSQKEKLFDLFKGANPLDYKKDEKASEVNVKETKTIPIIISDGFKVQENSWKEREKLFQNSIQELTTQLNNSSEQNKTLLTQLDELTEQMQSQSNTSSESAPDSGDKRIHNYLEVVNILLVEWN